MAKIYGGTTTTPLNPKAVVDFSNYYTKTEIDSQIGDIETVLDNIIALQNSYVGGVSE